MSVLERKKKKHEAKSIRLTAEEYIGYLRLRGVGISFEEYKRYLQLFGGKLDEVHFSAILRLRKNGFTQEQAERYVLELSKLIEERDYREYLEAEKLGLSINDFVSYVEHHRSKLSVADYADFLNNEKFKNREPGSKATEEDGPSDSCIDDETNRVDKPEYIKRGEVIQISKILKLTVPNSFIYTNDQDVIGENRILIAIHDGEKGDFHHPYLASECILVLKERKADKTEDMEKIKGRVGFKSPTVLTDMDDLKIIYEIKESSESLLIMHALVYAQGEVVPIQFFYNNSVTADPVSFSLSILNSIQTATVEVS